jgi:hypothetical protein
MPGIRLFSFKFTVLEHADEEIKDHQGSPAEGNPHARWEGILSGASRVFNEPAIAKADIPSE